MNTTPELQRACNPKEGDRWGTDEMSMVGTAVGDGKVWYDFQYDDGELCHYDMDLDKWPEAATESWRRGVKFIPAESNK